MHAPHKYKCNHLHKDISCDTYVQITVKYFGNYILDNNGNQKRPFPQYITVVTLGAETLRVHLRPPPRDVVSSVYA